MNDENTKQLKFLENVIAEKAAVTSSPSTTLEIMLDIVEASKAQSILGQMVYVTLKEDGRDILSIGQVVEVETKNRWHEDQSFKGVVKRYGALPNLSGVADNRTATLSVQSSFDVTPIKGDIIPQNYLLGMSPSTGLGVNKMTNDVIGRLVVHQRQSVSYIGKVYRTDVNLPMWFKHFGECEKNPDSGAGDAYHIGVFGRTGSGKTVTAAFMLLSYAKHKDNMNILVLDPQGQFSGDNKLLPGGEKFSEKIEQAGMKYRKMKLIRDIALPGDDLELFGDLLVNYDFIRDAFGPFYQDEKMQAMKSGIVNYIEGRFNHPRFDIGSVKPKTLLKEMVDRFLAIKLGEKDYSKYIKNVYAQKPQQERLRDALTKFVTNLDSHPCTKKWEQICSLFSTESGKKTPVQNLTADITGESRGNFIVLDLGLEPGKLENENLQALFLRLIEKYIVEAGGHLYAQGKEANCLIVMDEAHRFVSKNSPDKGVRELTKEIVDSVRTTRKYGIGHMFITQSLESMDEEIIKQMRIFAFGYGLTIGSELRKVGEIVNNKAAVDLYRSFIDPSNNRRFPFMFFGPVSPFSATGSPLFVEIYTNYDEYKKINGTE